MVSALPLLLKSKMAATALALARRIWLAQKNTRALQDTVCMLILAVKLKIIELKEGGCNFE